MTAGYSVLMRTCLIQIMPSRLGACAAIDHVLALLDTDTAPPAAAQLQRLVQDCGDVQRLTEKLRQTTPSPAAIARCPLASCCQARDG
jgi:hypothetical protein